MGYGRHDKGSIAGTWVRTTLCFTAIGMFGLPAAAAAGDLGWNPQRTWVFAVGLLEWQHPEVWASFPDAVANRSDVQLVELFRQAGVPKSQIVYLQDKQATKTRIIREFTRFLDRTDEGDLLVFYFAGHGYRDEATHQTWLAQYDAGDKNASGWNVKNVFKLIEDRFSGDRVLLLADCCHSGALCDEVLKRNDSDYAYAALTSVYSHNTSTGNWTFTDVILAALRGDPRIDGDADGIVELNELADYAEHEMAFVEGQKSMFAAAKEFPRNAGLAPVKGTLKPRVGERAEAFADGKWYKVQIVDAAGSKVKVHYIGYNDSQDAWLSTKQIRAYRPTMFAERARVDALSDDGKWYPATVLKAWYGLHLVHYDDYDSTWDQWLGPGAVRARK